MPRTLSPRRAQYRIILLESYGFWEIANDPAGTRLGIGTARAERGGTRAGRDRRRRAFHRRDGRAVATARRARRRRRTGACRPLSGGLSHGRRFPDHRRGGAA